MQQIFSYPSLLSEEEKLFLYSLLIGLKPKSVLEIGTGNGGGALIVRDALRFNGFGKLIVLDPTPQAIFLELFFGAYEKQYGGDVFWVKGYSPQDLPKCAEYVSGFDFIIIDGDHGCDAVIRDLSGSLPLLNPGGKMILHDAVNAEVRRGIATFLSSHPELLDHGLMVKSSNHDGVQAWGGYYLIGKK